MVIKYLVILLSVTMFGITSFILPTHLPKFRLSRINTAMYDQMQLIIQFHCDEIDPDELTEFLFELGTTSASAEVISEKEFILNDERNWNDLIKTKSWANAIVRANIPSSFDRQSLTKIIQDTYKTEKFQLNFENMEDKDWVLEVQQQWNPIIIGNLTVCFPWHTESDLFKVPKTNHRLLIEGGAAFGTGDHPTTRICCKWLESVISPTSANTTVLDYGCGSAILGMAALMFGASQADGVDIDKDALLSASNNCRLNDINMDLYVSHDNGEGNELNSEELSIVMNNLKGVDPIQENVIIKNANLIRNQEYDVVVANILAPILIQLAPELSRHTKSGGMIGLSGIVAPQATAVINEFQKYFSNVKIQNSEDDWVLITGIKK